MDAQTIAAIIVALGGGVGLSSLLKGVREWRNGTHAIEKERNQSALAQRDRADIARNRADRNARIALEHAAIVRRIALEHGVPVNEIPPWPTALKE